MTLALGAGLMLGTAHAVVPTAAPISGEIQHLSLTTPGDYWSGGTIVVGGQSIIIPRNLLADLPANRLTLWQLVDQARPEIVLRHQHRRALFAPGQIGAA